MSTYAIGDVQGCYDELMLLIEKIKFDPSKDILWFVGDLVNRGPYSLKVLRFVKSLNDRQVTVMGNHDIHLLAIAAGSRRLLSKDTFRDVLNAPDSSELIDWLRYRKFVHYSKEFNTLMVHAGIPPQWNLKKTLECAQEIEEVFESDLYTNLLKNIFNDQPDLWSDKLKGWKRYRYIINALTRIRYCDRQGRLDMEEKGPVEDSDPDLIPWFKMAKRKCKKVNIIFGHWASLNGETHMPDIIGLDTGCVWGRELMAYRLEDKQRFIVGKA